MHFFSRTEHPDESSCIAGNVLPFCTACTVHSILVYRVERGTCTAGVASPPCTASTQRSMLLNPVVRVNKHRILDVFFFRHCECTAMHSEGYALEALRLVFDQIRWIHSKILKCARKLDPTSAHTRKDSPHSRMHALTTHVDACTHTQVHTHMFARSGEYTLTQAKVQYEPHMKTHARTHARV